MHASSMREEMNERCRRVEFKKFGAARRYEMGCYDTPLPSACLCPDVLDALGQSDAQLLKDGIERLVAAWRQWQLMCQHSLGVTPCFDHALWRGMAQSIDIILKQMTERSNTMEDKHLHLTQEYIYGNKYDIHDNPNATFNFGCMPEREQEKEKKQEKEKQDEPAGSAPSTIVEELSAMFWGDKAEAEKFLMSIQNMSNMQITQLVNKLVKENIINDRQSKRPLYSVLNRHGYYTASESNWNSHVR